MTFGRAVGVGWWTLVAHRSLHNAPVHRAAANSLNIETRAARGSVCIVLLSGASKASVKWLVLLLAREIIENDSVWFTSLPVRISSVHSSDNVEVWFVR